MSNFYIALGAILIACISDVICNIFIKKSKGFRIWRWGLLALLFLFVTNTAITFSYTEIDLSVAYALFGVISLIFTTLMDRIMFGLKINFVGILGLASLISGIVLLRLA